MKAARVLRFGPPKVIINDDLPRPEPAAGQLLVRVKAAGVGNWDALIREGKVELQPLLLILGSELSGIVEAIGAEVSGFKLGDEVYGATNEQFTGAYAEYALPSARMMAQKPKTLNFIEAASAPIVTITAWQRLFDYAHVTAGQTVLIHGAAGNVGAYAAQLASQAGLHVVATAASADMDYVRGLGAERVVDYQTERFEESVTGVDVVLDTVGRHAAAVASSPEARWDSRLCRVTCSRGNTKTLWRSSSVFLCGCDYSAADQDHRTVRQRKTSYGRRDCAPAWKKLALPTRCLEVHRISAARSC